VAGVLADTLGPVVGGVHNLTVAGRTDAGVHATGQVCHLDIAADRWAALAGSLVHRLSGLLPPDVRVFSVAEAPQGFDARFSASAREYRYRIDVGPWPDPFEARYVWHRQGELSLAAMRTAARELLGEHDFASFCRRPPDDRSTVRRLERLAVARQGSRLEISTRANAFLHQMVRSLVGTLVAVGEGSRRSDEMSQILAARDRAAAGPVAPALGLTLERVVYGRRDPRA